MNLDELEDQLEKKEGDREVALLGFDSEAVGVLNKEIATLQKQIRAHNRTSQLLKPPFPSWAIILNGSGLWAIAVALLINGSRAQTMYVSGGPRLTDIPVTISTGGALTVDFDSNSILEVSLESKDLRGVDVNLHTNP